MSVSENKESQAVSEGHTALVWQHRDMAALALVTDAVWVFDLDRAAMWWANDAACRLWNASSLEQLLCRDYSDLSDASHSRLRAYARKFHQGGVVTEQWTLYPGGVPTTVSCTCSGIRIENGRWAMLVIAQPSTGISAEELRGIEALRHTTIQVSLYRRDGECLMRNPAAMRACPDAGQRLRDQFVDPTDADRALEALDTRGVYTAVVRTSTATGEQWHGMNARRTRDPVTGETAILVNEGDLTELVKAETALKASARRLVHMVENLPAGAAYVEQDQLYFNRAAEEITGYRRDEVPTLDAWFKAAYPDRHEDIRGQYERDKATGFREPTEVPIVRKDGVIRWIQFSGYATEQAEIWLLQDVTERREASEALRQERAMLQSLLESLPDIVFFKDRNGTYLNFNRAALAIAGVPAEQVTRDKDDYDLFDATTAEAHQHYDRIAMEQGSCRNEEWLTYSDGRRVLVETFKAACRDQDGNVMGVVGVSRDITERRRTEDQLRQERALIQGLIDTIPDAIFFKDVNGVFRNANVAVGAWVGRSPDALIGLTDYDIVPKDVAEEFRRHDVAAMAQHGTRRNEEVITLPSGRSIWVEMLKTPIRDADGTLLGVVGIGRDITERKGAEDRLRQSEAEKDHMANHDALTGLPNRRLFFDRLKMALTRSYRSDRHAGLLFIDLDGFKQVNDTFGHDFGDHVLRTVADRMSACLRDSDTLARMGGDEFTVIVEGVQSGKDLACVSEKIIAAVSAPIAFRGQQASLGASIGSAMYPLDATNADALIRAADNAMYAAKRAGRGCHVSSPEALLWSVS